MTELSFRERLARLGPTRVVGRVAYGSPAVFVLSFRPGQTAPRTIDATLALVRRGMEVLPAKRSVEELLEVGRVVVEVPTVEDEGALVADLAAAGFVAEVSRAVRDGPAQVEEADAPIGRI